MPIINRVAELNDEIAGWRRDIHAHPELLYDVPRTAGLVEDLLRDFGVDEITAGVGQSGVVGVIKGNGPGATVALRADMDALPIREATGLPHASTIEGRMHACGHDGHTAMLLGAAKYLCETRNFKGQVVVVFQPAEEGGGGGLAMSEDGLFSRWGIEEIYGLHNLPGLPVGEFATCAGPILGSVDVFDIEIKATGGHAAMPNLAPDPIPALGQMIGALQTIVSRSVDPMQPAVVSVTRVDAGDAYNVIPSSARLAGTVRTMAPEVRDLVETRMRDIVELTARMNGVTASLTYDRKLPATINAAAPTEFSLGVARDVLGEDKVIGDFEPFMGGEDFAFMLERCKGSYAFIGNGMSSGLHTDTYDFNDDLIPYGVSYLVRVAETYLGR